MKKFFAAAALAAATGAIAAPAAAAPAETGMDIIGADVNYPAAAEAEGMSVPTKDYKISARYGQSGSMWSSGRHTGLDFAAPEGTTITAADGGKVVAAEPAGAYGNMIEIAHGDGIRTRYAHLSDIDVKKGQQVTRGQHIGDLGNTGNSSGPHLHFEVLVDGDHADPEKFL
jgi:murein DD-endopeptidase MepM/ murein hydrolase activator NlpD